MTGAELDAASRMSEAVQAMSVGDIASAEAQARTILDHDVTHAPALNLLGVVAAQIGYLELAAGYLRQALESDPSFARAKENLATVRCAPMRASLPEGVRYLVIEAWGSGFWSDVTHVLGCLLLAEITGRSPVTHWGGNSLFSTGSGDAFRTYFEPVSSLTIDDMRALSGAGWFPPSTPGGKSGLRGICYLNRPESIAVSDSYVSVFQLLPWIPKTHPMAGAPVDAVYRYLAEKYLRPRGDVFERARAFYRERLAGGPTIAVHARGSDKWTEMRQVFPGAGSYFERVDREDPSARIFLLTDDLRVLAAFRERYGNRVIVTECQRTNLDVGLHLQPATDRVRLARDVIADVFIALRCGRFFGMGWSNVSAVIAMLRPWEAGTCYLLGDSILMNRFV